MNYERKLPDSVAGLYVFVFALGLLLPVVVSFGVDLSFWLNIYMWVAAYVDLSLAVEFNQTVSWCDNARANPPFGTLR